VNWIEIAAIVVLLLGIGAGGFLVAQRPTFWLGMLTAVVKELLPVILRRMTPAEEAAWRECQRRNGKWNHSKKRCE
jgi:hypothetical protein